MNDNPTPPQELPTPIPPTEPLPTPPSPFTPEPVHTPWYKKKLVLALLVIAVVAGGAAAWFVFGSNSDQKDSQSNTANNTPTEKPAPKLTPSAVAYSYRTDTNTTDGKCSPSSTTAYWRPLAGGDRSEATGFEKNGYVSITGVYENQVFVITDPSCSTTEGSSMWYSDDAGVTYTKIMSGKPAPSSEVNPDTFTSAIFSTDGSRIIFAFLTSNGSAGEFTNTVKTINPDTKQITDLFTVDSAGVFVRGYDTKSQNVIYYRGCYFCDGNTQNKLYEHNVAAKTDEVLFEETSKLGVQTVANADLSKILLVRGVQGEFLGASKPFTVQEFTVSSKTTKDIVTINEDTPPSVGYREGDETIYYTSGNSVFGYNGTAKPLTLFEASKPIQQALYVGKDYIVASSGTYNDYTLTNFDVTKNTANTILSGDEKTTLFGVVWK